ncbi:MAG: exonuclease SbcD, partial [Candidatus Paceibacteria bacterium]
MHLGRRPTRLPEELRSNHNLDPRAAWRAVVERAIAEKVDAVLLAGDVVDSKNHFMEAYGALQEGVRRLEREGIEVVCVAGNHDVEALPRLADELPHVKLLGRSGEWHSHIISRAGVPILRVIGWSFPRTHFESNPLDSMSSDMRAGRYGDGAPDDLKTVGLLHCDLDGSDRRYAPVSKTSLAQLDMSISAWFLGHNHGPTIRGGGRPVGYLGSLVGLDPGETGAHGPWLATAESGHWEMEHIPLSPVRWETLEVDVQACEDSERIQSALVRSLHEFEAELGSTLGAARVVGVRLRLVGSCGAPLSEIRDAMRHALTLELLLNDTHYFVDKVFDETRPKVDLELLAAQNDPVGIIAQRLIALEEGGAACAALIAGLRPRLEGVLTHQNL